MLQTTTGALLAGEVSHAVPAAEKRAIVIGGLSCAYDLVERGHNVTLLKAARCIGGRVMTIYDPLSDGQYAEVSASPLISSFLLQRQ
jgi:monoamine oxidase